MDNEKTRLQKMVQHSFTWATAVGATSLQEPEPGDNETTLWRKLEGNLYQMTLV
jgi:hypothetical protein